MSYSLADLEYLSKNIEESAWNSGLNFYEQHFEIINYKEMLSYEAYLGMPSRYPHWSFGKSFEKNRTLYKYNLTGLPYEMVINSNPCIAYLVKENTELLQMLTMAHVYGHNDFFKNNRMFTQGTDASNTLSMFKAHSDIIREYVKDPSIGYEGVENILDAAHALRFQVCRPSNFLAKDIASIIEEEEDLLSFILKYGLLEEWEKNIIEIVRKETLYFIPQMETKIMNEGWASYWHYHILKSSNLDESKYFEFIKIHNRILAPLKGEINPYYLGFVIFQSIEERFGRDKIFQVRELERDESFIRRYITQEICEELNLFSYEKTDSKVVVKDVADEEGWKNIRQVLCNNCGINTIPYIRIRDLEGSTRTLHLEHVFQGRELNLEYAKATLKYMFILWKGKIVLETRAMNKKISIICDSKNNAVIQEKS